MAGNSEKEKTKKAVHYFLVCVDKEEEEEYCCQLESGGCPVHCAHAGWYM